MSEYKPNLNNILSEEELKDTEKNSVSSCGKCTAGYINGKICNCLKLEMMKRRYLNANIDYDFASLELYDEEISAHLKSGDEKIKININKFIDEYVRNAKNNLNEGFGFIINGPVGRGKSLTTMKTLMRLVDKGYKCYWITIKNFLDVIKKSWEDDEYKLLLNKIYDSDFLVVDDIGTELHKTDWTIVEIDTLFRHRYFKKKVTIMTTNSTTKDLKEKYAQRIISLFNERLMFITIVSKEDYREKKAKKLPSFINIDNLKEEE